MIQGEAAIFLNVLSITAFSALLLVAIISLLVKLNPGNLNAYTAPSRRRILWLIALSPWLVGFVAAALALFSDSPYLPIPDSFDLLHWHHPQEFIFTSWHGLSTLFAVSYTGFIFIQNVSRLIQNSRQMQLLHALAEQDDDGFYQLDSDAPTAFTAGYSKPQCYITSALRRQLNVDEYIIVQLHEKEHARQFDPLKKWFYQLLTAFFPLSVSRQLNQWMVLAMEQCADSAVSRVIADKSLIAMTLIKVKRLAVRPFGNTLDDRALCHYGNDCIHERIHYLLSDESEKRFPAFLIILTTLSMSIICALSADIFHHLIEYTLSH